jgi:hypothetical protein
MAQVGMRNNQVPPADGLYTTLLIIAASMLFVAVVFVAVRSYQQFESLLPMSGV